ncbi:thioesterase family protein [Rhodococcus erythropolis]|uniref:acyl-CoA thioesterase n=1 Tax=Rhodococcus erythropolis TaxID=1833 RepID=UPI002949DE84|nr:thioesterase family protein [Rhodococcus erythropolis]MDV6212809.1 thioesterase family protein [Rhodococcus erythropolis]
MTTEPQTDDPRDQRRADFPVIKTVQLRWADIDTYGHINNAVHYELMDTAVNGWLGEATSTDIRTGSAIGLVVETTCQYLREINFPGPVQLGLRLARAGTSSVSYDVGFFIDNAGPAAMARFVHVYVDPTTRRPTQIPPEVRAALTDLTVE